MPLYFYKQIKNHSKIILWNLTETDQKIITSLNFNKKEKENVDKFIQKRKRQYLGIRYVLNYWNSEAQLSYDEKGAPSLKNFPNLKISISHSDNKIALAISKYEIGIDIEKYRGNQILAIQKKFLGADEADFINKETQIQQLQIIWGIKESLYKITKGKFVNFLENFKVLSFELNQKKAKCKLINPFFESQLEAHYEIIDNYFLVYLINDKDERID